MGDTVSMIVASVDFVKFRRRRGEAERASLSIFNSKLSTNEGYSAQFQYKQLSIMILFPRLC